MLNVCYVTFCYWMLEFPSGSIKYLSVGQSVGLSIYLYTNVFTQPSFLQNME